MAGLVRNILAGILGSPALLHPRETQWVQGALAAANAEVITDCDGSGSVSLDLRGTFSMTVEVAGTIDGVNWTLIPMKPLNQAAKLYVAAVTGAVQGSWVGSCAGFRKVRARVTAFTSGAATTVLTANLGNLDQWLDGAISTPITFLSAVGAVGTLTMPSPGAGLRNYLTYLAINKIASTAQVATATPIAVASTNLPNSMAWSVASNAMAVGDIYVYREDFAFAIFSTAQATATVITPPAVAGIIWRTSAAYYVAP